MTRKRTTENELTASPAAPARRPAAPRTRAKRPAAIAETPAATPWQAESGAGQPEPGATAPSHEDIARLAYSYWAGRAFQGGSAEEDWLRAESELKGRAAIATA